MGRRSSEDPSSGLEFLGLAEPSAPSSAASLSGSWPFAAPSALGATARPPVGPPLPPVAATPGAPLTRRDALNRENAAAQPVVDTAERIAPARARVAASTRQRSPRQKPRAASKVMSLAALLFAGALVVGMSVPANALMSGSPTIAAAIPAASVVGDQTVDVSADAANTTPSRDGFSVIDYAELTREEYGTQSFTYTVTNGAVRWPFPYAAPISDGFGARDAPCDGCSSFHLGVDFTPGAGTPIFAIADGIVTTHIDDFGSFGNHVIISHVINGQHIDSLYAHMETGSSALVPGQAIKVGDFIGLVGSTGESTGAHLHFEIHLDGVAIDPFAWLQANAVN